VEENVKIRFTVESQYSKCAGMKKKNTRTLKSQHIAVETQKAKYWQLTLDPYAV